MSVDDEHESEGRAASLRGCLEACRRCGALLDAVASDPASATERFGAVGPHLRHCLDHFVCLLDGLDSGTVDYDARRRDPRLERDPELFRLALDDVASRLRRLDPASLRRTVRVCQAAAPGGAVASVDSNLERELVFLSSHTIHHVAIMSLLARGLGADVPEDLAVAFSTEAHRRSAGAGAG